MKKKLIIFTLMVGLPFLVFTVIIPSVMKGKIPNVKKYLEHEGYSNIEYKEMNSLMYRYTFKTSNGDVTVQIVKADCYQIVY